MLFSTVLELSPASSHQHADLFTQSLEPLFSVRYSQTVCLLVGKLWLTTPYIYQPREKHVNPLKPLNTELGNKLPCQRFGTCSRLSSRVTPPGCYGGPTIQPESGRDSYWLLYCVVHSPFNHCQRKLLLFFFMATEVPQVKQTNI